MICYINIGIAITLFHLCLTVISAVIATKIKDNYKRKVKLKIIALSIPLTLLVIVVWPVYIIYNIVNLIKCIITKDWD